MIAAVDFCAVVQIFFPGAAQLHPAEFPGPSPGDCPRDFSRKRARAAKCTNAEHPDSYGHYREAPYTMTKHHWWFKAHFVFERLRVLDDYEGYVLFLEEDHYLAPDALVVLHQMADMRVQMCPRCDLLNMGTYKKMTHEFARKANHVSASAPWLSSRNNMGMAFTRALWTKIAACAHAFCTYDDYNWDWSLQQVGNTCLDRHLVPMVATAPRVFHIGVCGQHTHKGRTGAAASCSPAGRLAQVRNLLHTHAASLFPATLQAPAAVFPSRVTRHPLSRNNGGWGDIRDHEYCMAMGTLE